MSFFSSIFGWFGGNATTKRTGHQIAAPASSAHDDAPVIGVDSALQVSTVWACVNLLVETVASLPLKVYEVGPSGRVELTSGLLHQVMRQTPNRFQTPQEFWEQMMLNYFLRGNAFAALRRNTRGDVVSMTCLPSDQVDVMMLPDGSLMYNYRLDHEVLIYPSEEVLHIRCMGNGAVGLSPLDYMRSSVGLAINAQNHTTRTFKKEGKRPGILMSDRVLTQDQRAALRSNFSDIASGKGRELYILEAQFKFEPLGMSPADLQLLESRKFAVQDIARWFGVPSVLINDTGETTALGSSVSQIIDAFHRLKLRPQLERIEQAIEKRVLTPAQRAQGIQVEFNLDALLRASAKDRYELYAKAVQNGLKTRNECRAKENDPAIEGGDVLTAQVNLAPVSMLPIKSGGSVPPDTVRQ